MAFGNLRKLKSGRWQARYRYRGIDCKAPQTFKTKLQAQGWLAEEYELTHHDGWEPPQIREAKKTAEEVRNKFEEMTVSELVDDWLSRATNIGESTKRSHRKRLTLRAIGSDLPTGIDSLGPLRVVDVDRARIRLWIEQMLKAFPEGTEGYSTSFYARKRLNTAFSWAIDELELITENPVSKVSMKKPVVKRKDFELFTDEQRDGICAAFPDWLRHAPQILFWCGLRPGEATELRVKDIVGLSDGEPMELRVRRTATDSPRKTGRGKEIVISPIPKTNAGRREVPVPSWLADRIRHHLKDFGKTHPEDLVISTRSGGQMAEHYLRDRYFNPARNAVGRSSEDSDMYLCRNGFGTALVELVMAGKLTLEDARRLMGHETTDMLMKYMRLSKGYKARAASALEGLFKE